MNYPPNILIDSGILIAIPKIRERRRSLWGFLKKAMPSAYCVTALREN
jgi:hypothetical protein